MIIEIDGYEIAFFLVLIMLLILAWQTDKNRQRIEKLESRPTQRAVDATPTNAADSESNNGVRH